MEVIFLMTMLLFGICIGFIIGYPLGLFIDMLDRKAKGNGR